VVAGLAGAAALSGVAVLAAGGRAGENQVRPTHLTHATLTAEITAAVDHSSSDIFEAQTTGGDMGDRATHWLSADGNTLRVATYAADGSPVEDETLVTQGAQQVITDVDATTKTWWTITVPAPATSSAATGGEYPPGGLLAGSPTSAAGVAWLLNHGDFAKTGQSATVNGVANAFEIKSQGSATTIADAFANMEMWIDPATNLPVQVTLGVSNDVNGYALNAVPNLPLTYTIDPATPIVSNITWLSPTADNEAQLHSTVPAGFTQTAPPTAFDSAP
jgi:hypothetical protein